jgi:branched-chain amino acid transport system permease protein
MNRWATWLWLAFLFSIPLWMTDQYFLHILISAGIFIIAAMSLNLLLGYTGQLSLGNVAFFGIGGYTSALVSLGFDLQITDSYTFVFAPRPVWVAFLAGILTAGFFGWLVGRISFKIRGAYFVIVTISFAEVVRLVALNWIDLTEGPMALNNIPPFTLGIPGLWELTFLRKVPNYYLVLVTCILSYVVIARLVRSRLGRAMIALRENEPLAASVGVDVTRSLVLAAVVSAAMAGAAGGLYTHYFRIIDPDIFLFIYTVTMVIMVITGGKGTLAGPIVGGLIFGILPEVLREVASPEVQWVLYGLIMIAIVFFLPDGIVPALTPWWRDRFGAGGGGAEPEPGPEARRAVTDTMGERA